MLSGKQETRGHFRVVNKLGRLVPTESHSETRQNSLSGSLLTYDDQPIKRRILQWACGGAHSCAICSTSALMAAWRLFIQTRLLLQRVYFYLFLNENVHHALRSARDTLQFFVWATWGFRVSVAKSILQREQLATFVSKK